MSRAHGPRLRALAISTMVSLPLAGCGHSTAGTALQASAPPGRASFFAGGPNMLPAGGEGVPAAVLRCPVAGK